MSVKSPKEVFEKVMPQKFNAAKAAGIDTVIQMSFTGENAGDWIITVKDQKMEIKPGVHSSPAITVKMKDTDFVDMATGKLSGERAFMTGKLKFKGDMSAAMKLRDLGIL
jgi:putative sterol carrier protein